jgi:hypothetical protein
MVNALKFCVQIGDNCLDGGYSLLKGRDLHNGVARNGLLMSHQCDDQIASLFFQLNEGQSVIFKMCVYRKPYSS